jgi:Amt family ammonium transporter
MKELVKKFIGPKEVAAFKSYLRAVLASAVTMVFSFVMSFIIAKAIDKTIGMRVTEDEENEGLDYSQHAETAYSFGSTGSMDRI